MLGFSPDGFIMAQSSEGNIQEILGLQSPLNTWTHIALTYEYDDRLQFYVNGTLIGHTNFIGMIEEFRIYSRCLNITDIQTIIRFIHLSLDSVRYHTIKLNTIEINIYVSFNDFKSTIFE